MECNEIFSVSSSTMFTRAARAASAPDRDDRKQLDRIWWNGAPMGTLHTISCSPSTVQRSVQPSSSSASTAAPAPDTGTGSSDVRQRTLAALASAADDDRCLRRHDQPVDLETVLVDGLKLSDAAVLDVSDADVSVQRRLSVALASRRGSVDVVGGPGSKQPAASGLAAWLELCHCERHLLSIKLFYLAFLGSLGVVISYMVVFLKQLGLSAFQIGLISGVRPLLGFVSAPVWGAVADRYKMRRVLMLMSMCAWLAFYVALYLIQTPARRPNTGLCPAWVNSTTTESPEVNGTSSWPSFNDSTSNLTTTTMQSNSSEWTEPSPGGPCEISSHNVARRADLGWLYEPSDSLRVFIICLVVICGGELFQSPTTAMSDAATLQVLGRRQLNKYAAQRAWGPVGWAASTLLTGVVLNSYRRSEYICDVCLVFTDYRVIPVIFSTTFFVSFLAAVKINFAVSNAQIPLARLVVHNSTN